MADIDATSARIKEDDAEAHAFGSFIAVMMNLKVAKDENGVIYVPYRYTTVWGTKTAIGFARTMIDVLEKRTF